MKKIRRFLERLLPPGMDPKTLCGTFITGAVISVLASLSFWLRYTTEIYELYETVGGKSQRIEGTMMPDFIALLGDASLENALACFMILACIMPLFAIYHYLYHRQGARSDYLMRRLPRRWVWHARCLALPLLAGAAALVLGFTVLMLDFGMYMLFTPGDAILPGQWMKIWSVL